MPTAPLRIDALQILRFIAAGLIVLHHTIGILHSRNIDGIPPIPGLIAGVDIFFVLSGFIMVHAFSPNGRRSAFMLKRIFRIVPLYWLLTTLLWVMAAAAPQRFNTVDADPAAWLMALSFLPQTLSGRIVEPVLHVGWTLNYEMAFYALFAACFAGTASRTAGRCAGVLVGLVIAGQIFDPADPVIAFYTSPLLLEFAAGMGAALLCRHKAEHLRPAAPWLLAAGILLLVLQGVWPVGGHRALIYGVPGLGIVLGTALLHVPHGWCSRAAIRLGDASYALYLVHPLVLATAAKLLIDTGHLRQALPLALIMMTLSVLAAFPCRHLVERPAQAWLQRRLNHRDRVQSRTS